MSHLRQDSSDFETIRMAKNFSKIAMNNNENDEPLSPGSENDGNGGMPDIH